MATTWSKISSGLRLRIRASLAVAQKRQSKLQPTWEETQAVVRSLTGIKTDSTIRPSNNWTAFLIVPSVLRCCWSTAMWLMMKCSSSSARVAFDKLVMPSKLWIPLFHSHWYTCFPRNALSPCSTKNSCNSSKLSARMSFFRAVMCLIYMISMASP